MATMPQTTRKAAGAKLIRMLLLVILLAFVGAIIAYYIFSDQIKQLLISQVNRELKLEVNAKAIEPALWQHFPYLSLNMDEVNIKRDQKPFLEAREFSILFHPFDVIRGTYNLKQIVLVDAVIHWIPQKTNTVAGEEKPAFSDMPVDLRYLDLQNVHFIYKASAKEAVELVFNDALIKGKMEAKKGSFTMSGLLTPVALPAGLSFLDNKELFTHLELNAENQFKTISVNLEEIKLGDLSCRATVALNENTFRVNIKGNKGNWSAYQKVIPEHVVKALSVYGFQGKIKAGADIKGRMKGGDLEYVRSTFELYDGIIDWNRLPGKLNKVYISGTYHENFVAATHPVLNLKKISAGIGDSEATGSIKITGFTSPLIELNLNAGGKIKNIVDYLAYEEIKNPEGDYSLHINSSLLYDAGEGILARDVINSETSGHLYIDDCFFRMKANPLEYENVNLKAGFVNNELHIEKLSARMAGSDLAIKGRLRNALSFALLNDEQLFLDAELDAGKVIWDEILPLTNKPATTSRLKLPSRLKGDIALKIGKMQFGKFIADNVRAKLHLSEKALRVENMSLEAMDGSIEGGGAVNTLNNDLISTSSRVVFNQVNLPAAFYQFGEFNQESLTHKNLKGTVDAEVEFHANWSPNLHIKPESVITNARINVSGGELIGYHPLNYLSKYFPNTSLEHVKFSTLENTIHIYDQQINIPYMTVHSNTFDFQVEGTHSFANEIDYRFRILLSEILNPGREREEISRFGLIEDDGVGKSRVYLRLSGTVADPYLKYDKEGLKEKLARDMEQEKREIRQAFHKEFEWLGVDSLSRVKRLEQKEQIKRQEEGEFIIKWKNDDRKKSD